MSVDDVASRCSLCLFTVLNKNPCLLFQAIKALILKSKDLQHEVVEEGKVG